MSRAGRKHKRRAPAKGCERRGSRGGCDPACSPRLIFTASLHMVHNRLLQPDSKCDRQGDGKAKRPREDCRQTSFCLSEKDFQHLRDGKRLYLQVQQGCGAPSVAPLLPKQMVRLSEAGPSVQGGSARARWAGCLSGRCTRVLGTVTRSSPGGWIPPQGFYIAFFSKCCRWGTEPNPAGLLHGCQRKHNQRLCRGKLNFQQDADPGSEELAPCPRRRFCSVLKHVGNLLAGRCPAPRAAFSSCVTGCTLDLGANRAGAVQMYSCLPFLCIPKPKCCVVPGNRLLSSPPTAALGAGLRQGPSPPSFPQPAARPSRSKAVSHFRNPEGWESSACNLPFPASLFLLPGRCLSTPAPCTERPWQGETLLPPAEVGAYAVQAMLCPRRDAETPPPPPSHLRGASHPSHAGKQQAAAQGWALPPPRAAARVWAPSLLILVTYSRILGGPS